MADMNLTDMEQVRGLLIRHGFHFSKSMGQNFLTARWVPEQLSDMGDIDENTGVLEIGPGVGCLTAELSRRARRVLSIELDRSLQPVLEETLEGRDNVEIVFGDALKLDIPALLEEKLPGMRHVVCANIPYNITSPLLSMLLESGLFDTVTVLMQREVARRICAGPGDGDYGAFGIFVNYYARPEILFDVPPSCFVPQPKVTSSVIRLRRREKPPVSVSDEELLFRVIRAAFSQRRKTLSNALSSAFGSVPKARLAEIIENAGFDSRIRGESLDIVGFAKISDEIYRVISEDL